MAKTSRILTWFCACILLKLVLCSSSRSNISLHENLPKLRIRRSKISFPGDNDKFKNLDSQRYRKLSFDGNEGRQVVVPFNRQIPLYTPQNINNYHYKQNVGGYPNLRQQITPTNYAPFHDRYQNLNSHQAPIYRPPQYQNVYNQQEVQQRPSAVPQYRPPEYQHIYNQQEIQQRPSLVPQYQNIYNQLEVQKRPPANYNRYPQVYAPGYRPYTYPPTQPSLLNGLYNNAIPSSLAFLSNIAIPGIGLTNQLLRPLEEIARNDDLQCIPKIICQMIDDPKRRANLPKILSSPMTASLISALPLASPVLTFGKAAFIGITGGNSRCQYEYPKCPRDEDDILYYLNNHRGGFFRLFKEAENYNDGNQNQYGQNNNDYNQANFDSSQDSNTNEPDNNFSNWSDALGNILQNVFGNQLTFNRRSSSNIENDYDNVNDIEERILNKKSQIYSNAEGGNIFEDKNSDRKNKGIRFVVGDSTGGQYANNYDYSTNSKPISFGNSNINYNRNQPEIFPIRTGTGNLRFDSNSFDGPGNNRIRYGKILVGNQQQNGNDNFETSIKPFRFNDDRRYVENYGSNFNNYQTDNYNDNNNKLTNQYNNRYENNNQQSSNYNGNNKYNDKYSNQYDNKYENNYNSNLNENENNRYTNNRYTNNRYTSNRYTNDNSNRYPNNNSNRYTNTNKYYNNYYTSSTTTREPDRNIYVTNSQGVVDYLINPQGQKIRV